MTPKPQEWREEFDKLMWECGYLGERAAQGRKDIKEFVADQIALAEKRGAETERGICRCDCHENKPRGERCYCCPFSPTNPDSDVHVIH